MVENTFNAVWHAFCNDSRHTTKKKRKKMRKLNSILLRARVADADRQNPAGAKAFVSYGDGN